MFKIISFCTICLSCLAYHFNEDLVRQIQQFTEPPPNPFVSQTVKIPPEFLKPPAEGGEICPDKILDQLSASLKKMDWLQVTLWNQSFEENSGEKPVESETQLNLGPQQLARLDMKIPSSKKPFRYHVVSDGHVLGILENNGEKKVNGFHLPTNSAEREQVLAQHGCGGPLGMVNDLRKKTKDWQAKTGKWKGQEMILLTGLIEEAEDQSAGKMVNLYLDAKTLWPHRIEWRGDQAKGERPLHWVLEYRRPMVNQVLSSEECARLFSIQEE